MKKFSFITLVCIAIIAVAVGFAVYRASGDKAVQQALAKRDALEWLRADFALTEKQFAAIKQLHESYSLVCEEHCREILRATRAREDLKAKAEGDAGAFAAADRRVEELRQVCETAITKHVRNCAAEMSPEAGQRYLALVLPKIKDFDHMAAPNPQLSPHAH